MPNEQQRALALRSEPVEGACDTAGGRRWMLALVAAVAINAVSGCADRYSEIALKQFGTGVAATTELIAAAPRQYDRLHLARHIESDYMESKYGVQRALAAPVRPHRLDPQALRLRVELLAAMTAYAEALARVNDPEFKSKLKTAVTKLTASLVLTSSVIGAPLALPLVTPVQKIVSTGVSYLLAESNYALAMRTVRRMDPVVQEACRELDGYLDELTEITTTAYREWLMTKSGRLQRLRDMGEGEYYTAFLDARRTALKFQSSIAVLRDHDRLLKSLAAAHAELASGEQAHVKLEEFLAVAEQIIALANGFKAMEQS